MDSFWLRKDCGVKFSFSLNCVRLIFSGVIKIGSRVSSENGEGKLDRDTGLGGDFGESSAVILSVGDFERREAKLSLLEHRTVLTTVRWLSFENCLGVPRFVKYDA